MILNLIDLKLSSRMLAILQSGAWPAYLLGIIQNFNTQLEKDSFLFSTLSNSMQFDPILIGA